MRSIICLFLISWGLPLISPAQFNVRDDKVSLEEIWLSPLFFPESASEFRWMLDDQYYSVLEEGRIARYSIVNEQKVDDIVNLSQLLGPAEAQTVETYSFSPDEQKVLVVAESEPIYRRSSKEKTSIIDRADQQVLLLHGGAKVSNATFSPDGGKVAFTFENNLYYHDLASDKEVQITSDGEINSIINGSTDWVYEEEFAFTKAFYWSPDSRHIGFIRFDESEVQEFSMPIYGSLYAEPYVFKYPKAGDANAVVSVHVYDLAERKTVQADIGEETDIYIARMKWMQDNRLAALRLNRLQNQIDLLVINPQDGKSFAMLTEETSTYLREPTDDKWHFLPDGEHYIWLSEKDGYQHIYIHKIEGSDTRQLTEGKFEVEEIVGIDEKNERIYYISTEVSPMERHLYTVDFKGKKKRRLSEESGTHSITPSSDFNYYVDTYSNANTPPITVLRDQKGKAIKTLVKNSRIEKQAKQLAISPPEYFDFTTDAGVKLNAWMIKPQDFDPNKRYPVLMFVYGGPGSQTVTNAWGSGRPMNYFWYQMLAQQGYIVASVDNRGTGGRGKAFRDITYADLGNLETQDQIASAKYFQGLSYVDPERIGIWGWSYGGYMTSLCMTKGEGLFKMGIAVAPVTNWRFYDTIYTERFLKTPQLNAKGYDENSPLNFAQKLEGHYLLVHGTADDNVHFQNSMEMVDALVNANKQFDTFFYPNKNHGIYGGYTRYHLYKKMTEFILEHL